MKYDKYSPYPKVKDDRKKEHPCCWDKGEWHDDENEYREQEHKHEH